MHRKRKDAHREHNSVGERFFLQIYPLLDLMIHNISSIIAHKFTLVTLF